MRLVRTSDYADAVESIRDAEVIVEHGMSNDLLAEASSLEWVQSLSAGVNRYDLTPLERRDVLLTTVSGAHAQPAAEHVLGLLLFFERGVDRARRQQRDSVWRRFPASELASKTVGIVGVGQIGGRVAEVVSALGSEVVGTKRDTGTCPDAIDAVYPPDRLHTVLGQSDYLVLACPLTDETEQLIGETELSSMHNDAVLVNVARGEVVDQEALVSALKEGYLGGAALDVTAPEPLPGESPLWDMDDVVITPHMAGGSPEFARRCADVFVSNFQRYREGEYDAMRNRVL
ncbi:D-isomer specific 2-hydroxyacid dehydrogenase NAD-binding protein [Halosimplex carlsbadense 2-9-1]|uniref:D-isomer specific 2-hydroxyacid dehydrogenase NAD-binding protein n=1 Tax=Halosimplex carlsbadense 2-9-1 TaxID=797114 RepID=M0CWG3_9EURY|nr:D-isomer specific 2-hydroxyacid dehydrogenase NAD-binding protein [Halosimplex carlsbadense 2-9-1]